MITDQQASKMISVFNTSNPNHMITLSDDELIELTNWLKSNIDMVELINHETLTDILIKHLHGNFQYARSRLPPSLVNLISITLNQHLVWIGQYNKHKLKFMKRKIWQCIHCGEQTLKFSIYNVLYEMRSCPTCSDDERLKIARRSKGEFATMIWLENKNIDFKREQTFKTCINPLTGKRLRFDFFLPTLNTCIEYQGIQHFVPNTNHFGHIYTIDEANLVLEAQQYRDKIKQQYCDDNNINLITLSSIADIHTKLQTKLT